MCVVCVQRIYGWLPGWDHFYDYRSVFIVQPCGQPQFCEIHQTEGFRLGDSFLHFLFVWQNKNLRDLLVRMVVKPTYIILGRPRNHCVGFNGFICRSEFGLYAQSYRIMCALHHIVYIVKRSLIGPSPRRPSACSSNWPMKPKRKLCSFITSRWIIENHIKLS